MNVQRRCTVTKTNQFLGPHKPAQPALQRSRPGSPQCEGVGHKKTFLRPCNIKFFGSGGIFLETVRMSRGLDYNNFADNHGQEDRRETSAPK